MKRPLLFERFPSLAGFLEWVELGEFPTPVEELGGLGREHGISSLYIKRDDLSSPYYGGNKVRKLEFLLGRAASMGRRCVVTLGGAGSNHVLATVIHGERLGIRTIAVLTPQPNAAYVRKNLLLDAAHGADFIYTDRMSGLPLAIAKSVSHSLREEKRPPFVIPPGGTSARGCLGYVEAALELKRQVDEGAMPAPEYIFVTLGSAGTAAGLIIGVEVAGLGSTVVPVRVVDRYMTNEYTLALHVNNTRGFLRRRGADVGRHRTRARDLPVVNEFAGECYAKFTPECMEAVESARRLDGIKLDGTYTGKTMAGALDFIKARGLEGRVCLFWNTLSSADLYPEVADDDYHCLPPGLQRYFEEPLQEEEMGCEIVY